MSGNRPKKGIRSFFPDPRGPMFKIRDGKQDK